MKLESPLQRVLAQRLKGKVTVEAHDFEDVRWFVMTLPAVLDAVAYARMAATGVDGDALQEVAESLADGLKAAWDRLDKGCSPNVREAIDA